MSCKFFSMIDPELRSQADLCLSHRLLSSPEAYFASPCEERVEVILSSKEGYEGGGETMMQYRRKERRDFTKKQARTPKKNTTTAPHTNSLLIALSRYNLAEPRCNKDIGGIVDALVHGGHDSQVRHYSYLSILSDILDTVRGKLCSCVALRGHICVGARIQGVHIA